MLSENVRVPKAPASTRNLSGPNDDIRVHNHLTYIETMMRPSSDAEEAWKSGPKSPTNLGLFDFYSVISHIVSKWACEKFQQLATVV